MSGQHVEPKNAVHGGPARELAPALGQNEVPHVHRRFPIGAEVQDDGLVHFRVWAPASRHAAVELANREEVDIDVFPLGREHDGYFSGIVPAARVGSRYRIRLDSGAYPDPASRFQPEGPHGPSQVIDPRPFRWTDQSFRGRAAHERVIYEMHVGTFSRDGTWRGAMEELPRLAELGVTVLEVMPIADFPGQFGWGYDGVNLFAPTRLYGAPDDARAFVNRAHEFGLMVILDVVYNHLGPDGNFLTPFSPDYFTSRYKCEWGDALNFDGPNAAAVREFFVANARYWIDEFHFDGLRLDATQQIFDSSAVHILAEIGQAARRAGAGRAIFLVAENEAQESKLVRPYEKAGYGLDAIWNDDLHHVAMVSATGRIEAYYSDYRGTPQEYVSAVKYGFLYQGQWYGWQQQRRGTPSFDLPSDRFVAFLQNHDQIANSLRGLRLHQQTSPGKAKALTALLLLAPWTPMLFQGQEFAASAPFLYFADHHEQLKPKVREGRHRFLWQFRSIACDECRDVLAEPGDRGVFESCKLDFSERERNAEIYRFHRQLLKLRREEPPIHRPDRIDGAVLGPSSFVIRFFSRHGDRILLVNLGADQFFNPCPEPLLAPLENQGWTAAWSSEDPRYGGCGVSLIETTQGWIIPGDAAVLMKPYEHNQLQRPRLSQDD